jgi:hypothetical protein
MARSKSSKSLESKTTRRAAKSTRKAKPAKPCPVEAIARRQLVLLQALDEIADKLRNATAGSEPDKGTLEFRRRELWDRCQENRSEASRFNPTSSNGAMFLLGSVLLDLDHLDLNNEVDKELRRRARRSIYALKFWIGATDRASCVKWNIPDNNSPHMQTRCAVEYRDNAFPEGAAS